MVPSHRESVTLWQIDARIRPGDGQVLKNVYHWSEKSMEWQKSNPTDWGTHSSNAHLLKKEEKKKQKNIEFWLFNK